jgi:short-subunit dehydrogenase
MNVKGKVAIVTGASVGIGLATARLLSSKGTKLALVARSKGKLDTLAKELPNSIAIPADLSKVENVKSMVKQAYEHFGRVNILINNAGQGYDAPIEKIDVDTLRCIFELDFLAPVVAMQQVIPIMRKEGGGAIMNVSSGLALMYLPGMSIYPSLKRALSHISLTAREELKADKIAVSVVYPYITMTDFEKNTVKVSERDWISEGNGAPFKPDTAEYVAQKLLKALNLARQKCLYTTG